MVKFLHVYHSEIFLGLICLVIIFILYYVFKERRLMQNIASLDNVILGMKKTRSQKMDDLHAAIDLSAKTVNDLREIRTKLIEEQDD